MQQRFKFPRTPHLPWSPGYSGDDIRLTDLESFRKMKEVVITEKLDGENSTILSDGYVYARSVNGSFHPSQDWLKNYIRSSDCYTLLPEGYRICGESVYAIHSIEYSKLPTAFFVFNIIDNDNCALSWEETLSYITKLQLTCVPLIYRGLWDEKTFKELKITKSQFGGIAEGYVIRNAERFSMNDYGNNVAKYVREHHVQTDRHWTRKWKPAQIKK